MEMDLLLFFIPMATSLKTRIKLEDNFNLSLGVMTYFRVDDDCDDGDRGDGAPNSFDNCLSTLLFIVVHIKQVKGKHIRLRNK